MPGRSGYPEDMNFRDTGCELAPSCLNCRLPRCQYDQPGAARRLLTETRDAEIARRCVSEGIPINALARQYGLSRRSVFRILRKARLSETDLPQFGQGGNPIKNGNREENGNEET